ncbi:hypothetical protein [Xylella fastidiosa]|uniref:hypothetical protein n=1 Tax=Xylella fastidiosa TaxID=2371 RepID=UPI0000459B91|nr:hypothetical protein [Xylella fastidiosa]
MGLTAVGLKVLCRTWRAGEALLWFGVSLIAGCWMGVDVRRDDPLVSPYSCWLFKAAFLDSL